MKRAHLLALTAVAALCTSQVAVAQFEWLDHNGRHVFSDQMPPADIPEQNILKQPHVTAPAAAARAAPAASGPQERVDAAQEPTGNGADTELEQKRQAAEAAEQARLEAQERQQQAARAENCERAQQSKRTLESGMRMARVNDAGERIVLDDAQRAAELERANEIIASDC